MKRTSGLVLIAGALVASVAMPSLAQAPAQKPTKGTDANEVICEKQQVLGSRLATRRVCKTRSQWAQDRLDDRQDLERRQVQRPMTN